MSLKHSVFFLLTSVFSKELHHQRTDQSQNRVELRESGVDKGVCEHIVTLAYAHDTVGADLTLTNG